MKGGLQASGSEHARQQSQGQDRGYSRGGSESHGFALVQELEW